MVPRIYICFTCLRDRALLPLHYEALQRATGGVPVYYVFDKAEALLANVPAGAHKITSDFPRKGNLLGLACHLGMLQTMRQLAQRHGEACAVKIDSDVAVLSDSFLDALGLEHEMVGVAPAREYYCKGTCYGMTQELIGKVIHYLTHGYQDRSDRLEDSTISMVAAIVSEAHKVCIHNAIAPDNQTALYSAFHSMFRREPALIHRVSGFIDCGDPVYTSAYPDATAAKAEAMQFVLQQTMSKAQS